jgi:hypothetical protein
MPKTGTPIHELFHTPDRYLRSVQLERDFQDVATLDHYVLTPPMAEAFQRIGEGLLPGSGRRAWRVTGDYGVGKSSFALVLAHLLSTPTGGSASHLAGALGWNAESLNPRLWPILLTGSRGGIVPAIARAIGEAVVWRKPSRGRVAGGLIALAEKAREIEASGDLSGLEELLELVREQAAGEGRGLLLIVDELGKFLEHAALRPEQEDVFVLQRLAELAARSGDKPFLLLCLLHQGFQAYAERLPSVSRHEWEKVAGRFEEIVFDQPLAHTAALVAGALNIDPSRLPSAVRKACRVNAEATAATGWLGGGTTSAATLDAARLYPLHPTLLPVAVRFFARFGQHERSLFGFLLSSEPFGLQAFARQSTAADRWYGLPEFYDYVRAVFGHRLAGASYRSQWLRIVATVDAAAELPQHGLRVLKAVAVLSLLDADDLLATERSIHACFSSAKAAHINAAIGQLTDRGLLFRRGAAGALRLWPHSSVSLEAALAAAARALGPVESVAAELGAHLDRSPVLARRHYVERGTLRYFELRYAQAQDLADSLATPAQGDGIVLISLADTRQGRALALKAATGSALAERQDLVVGVIQPLMTLAPELHDVRCWQWVSENTPELAEDAYAAAEVARQLAAARRALADRLTALIGLRAGTDSEVEWFHAGRPVAAPPRGGVSALLSDVCDEVYQSAPRITNELLNRNTLSSAASAARMRLVEGLFKAADRPLLGFDPVKSPPEKSMYLSVLKRGGVHIEANGRFSVVEPEADPLNLRPAMDRMVELIAAGKGGRVAVPSLLEGVRSSPWGVRAGVSPLLLAILLQTRGHELAVYEQGTFLHRFGPSDFLRLTKVPANFEIQHCKIAGVRLDVFRELVDTYVAGVAGRQAELLDVVRALCHFAAQLPDYTRRTNRLGAEALAVRDALLSAREPVSLLFQDLPEACGAGAFSPDEVSDPARVRRFVEGLHDAVEELRGAYAELLARIIDRVAAAFGDPHATFDRAALANRASRVSLGAREPRFRAFALRLRDPQLNNDAWVESLASFVVSKPPSRWVAGDEARFGHEMGELAELFNKVEALCFAGEGLAPPADAIRLNLTRGDGEDLVRVLQPRAVDDDLRHHAELLNGRLPQDPALRLHLLTRMLWNELKTSEASAAQSADTDARQENGR